MMTKAAAISFSALLLATPALATGEVYCEATDDSGAVFGYEFGQVPGLAVLGATIHANGTSWNTQETDGAIPIMVAQGAYDGAHTLIDFADPSFIEIIASVRLMTAREGDDHVTVGTLLIHGVGVYPLACVS